MLRKDRGWVMLQTGQGQVRGQRGSPQFCQMSTFSPRSCWDQDDAVPFPRQGSTLSVLRDTASEMAFGDLLRAKVGALCKCCYGEFRAQLHLLV